MRLGEKIMNSQYNKIESTKLKQIVNYMHTKDNRQNGCSELKAHRPRGPCILRGFYLINLMIISTFKI